MFYLLSFEHTTFCTAPTDVRHDKIHIYNFPVDYSSFLPHPIFHVQGANQKKKKKNELLMCGFLSWGVIFKSVRPPKQQNVMKHQPKPLIFALELFPSTKESILKKLLHVERSTVKLLKAVLHHFCSDKDQESRLYVELLKVSI